MLELLGGESRLAPTLDASSATGYGRCCAAPDMRTGLLLAHCSSLPGARTGAIAAFCPLAVSVEVTEAT
jgi:hypothetical protein